MEGVMSFEDLEPISNLMNIPASLLTATMIYYLIKDGEVVYVGKTKKGLSRPMAHQGDKEFDSISVQPCSEYSLDRLESKAIRKYVPLYNKDVGACNHPLDTLVFSKVNKLFPEQISEVAQLDELMDCIGIRPFLFKGKRYVDEDDISQIVLAILNLNEQQSTIEKD